MNTGTISTTGSPLATINIQGGLLEGNGTISANVTDAAILSPGLSAGTLTISGDLTVTATSQFKLEIGGVTQGTGYDFLSEGGTVALNLNGTLDLSLINGFVPNSAALFTVVGSNQNLTGAFLNVANGGRLFASNGGGSFQVNYGPASQFAQTAVVLSSFAVPEPSVVGLLLPAAIALLGARMRKWGRR